MAVSKFWVVNTSCKNVTLSDLGLVIPPNRIYNLLDNKHFYYNLKQLKISQRDGSLAKKNDKIKICIEAPSFEKTNDTIIITYVQ